MALCCIGGVCIPYSAIVPLLLYGLQWLLNKLAIAGLLPPTVLNALARFLPSQSPKGDCCSNSSSRQDKQLLRRRSKISKQNSTATTASSCCSSGAEEQQDQLNIATIDDEEDLNTLLVTCDRTVVLKFTAKWCKPCKAIQPLYEQLAASNTKELRFAVVDADDMDEAAARYGVMALPTFVAVSGGKVVQKYAGSDETKLRELVDAASTKTK